MLTKHPQNLLHATGNVLVEIKGIANLKKKRKNPQRMSMLNSVLLRCFTDTELKLLKRNSRSERYSPEIVYSDVIARQNL